MSLRTKLIAVFLLATLAPLGAMLWVTIRLLETSLTYASTDELDSLSKSLESTGREMYQRARESVQEDAADGKLAPQRFFRPRARIGRRRSVRLRRVGAGAVFPFGGDGGPSELSGATAEWRRLGLRAEGGRAGDDAAAAAVYAGAGDGGEGASV